MLPAPLHRLLHTWSTVIFSKCVSHHVIPLFKAHWWCPECNHSHSYEPWVIQSLTPLPGSLFPSLATFHPCWPFASVAQTFQVCRCFGLEHFLAALRILLFTSDHPVYSSPSHETPQPATWFHLGTFTAYITLWNHLLYLFVFLNVICQIIS